MFKNTRFYVNFTQAYILISLTVIAGAYSFGAYKQAKMSGRRFVNCLCDDIRKTVNACKGK